MPTAHRVTQNSTPPPLRADLGTACLLSFRQRINDDSRERLFGPQTGSTVFAAELVPNPVGQARYGLEHDIAYFIVHPRRYGASGQWRQWIIGEQGIRPLHALVVPPTATTPL